MVSVKLFYDNSLHKKHLKTQHTYMYIYIYMCVYVYCVFRRY